MAQTKLANLVNPQVMADMVSAALPKKIKFAPIARIDTTWSQDLVTRSRSLNTRKQYAPLHREVYRITLLISGNPLRTIPT